MGELLVVIGVSGVVAFMAAIAILLWNRGRTSPEKAASSPQADREP